jgi:hypothetical protein
MGRDGDIIKEFNTGLEEVTAVRKEEKMFCDDGLEGLLAFF